MPDLDPRMPKSLTRILVVTAAALALPLTAAAVDVGEPAPDFSLLDETGQQVALSDYEDRTVVLEWINSDCPYSRRHTEEGTMTELAQQYADEGVVWLAINSTHYMDSASDADWIEEHDLGYRILSDSDGEVGHAFDAKTTPHMFVIENGTVVYNGAIDNDPHGEKDQRNNYVDAALTAVANGSTPDPERTKPYGCSVKYS